MPSNSPLSPAQTTADIAVEHIGLLDYEQALKLQREIHADVVSKKRVNTLLFLEHPSVYTAGKRTQSFELPSDGTPVVNVDRGGRITWHGPGQLVGYPIVRLLKPTELVGFVRTLEEALIMACREIGVTVDRVDGRSGVWVCDSKGDRKIAAIGIRVASGVTMHGFALNVCPDLAHFGRIVPCGIDDAAVTSIEKELDRAVNVAEITPIVEKYLLEALGKVSV